MAFKMKGKSMTQGTSAYKKALVGKQGNLPEGLKSKIEAAPTKFSQPGAGGPGGDDPKTAAAKAQGREVGEMNKSSKFHPDNVGRKRGAESGFKKKEEGRSYPSPEHQAKKVISSGKIDGKEVTDVTKGARYKKGTGQEKGKKQLYTKQDSDTYTKETSKVKKGDPKWESKKTKTISAKKAERQIERKTKQAERSGKRAEVKNIKGVVKEARKGEGKQTRKYYKEKGKSKIKEIRNR